MPNLTTNQVQKCRQVIDLAINDPTFRGELAKNAANAIDDYQQQLGFGSRSLSSPALKALGSLTDDELNALASVYTKGDLPRLASTYRNFQKAGASYDDILNKIL